MNKGFYIDVGANDPVEESVTKLFYDAGWNGINIEPLNECYQRLNRLRERDINIQALVGCEKGACVLHEFPEDSRYSTVDQAIAERHERTLGLTYNNRELSVLTLSSVFEQHAPQDVHFLKIDVEGHEAEVLRGFDLARFRPWILLIEATEPYSTVDSSFQWESFVTEQGYLFAYFDGLSKFYVAQEKMELLPLLQIPANVCDNYVTAKEASMEVALRKTESLRWLAAKLYQVAWIRVKTGLSNAESTREKVVKS